MICKVCGRTITNETANFCEYCGTSFRPGTDNRFVENAVRKDNYSNQGSGPIADGYTTAGNQQDDRGQGMSRSKENMSRTFLSGLFDSSDRPMTTGNWMIIYLLPFIPLVGTILFLVVLFSWGFGAKVAPTKKSWARATLIMVVVLIFMLAFMISSGYFGDPNALLESIYGTNTF